MDNVSKDTGLAIRIYKIVRDRGQGLYVVSEMAYTFRLFFCRFKRRTLAVQILMIVDMKRYTIGILFWLLSIFSLSAQGRHEENFKLQNGDIIFQEACSGNMNEAIKAVTTAIEGYNFTHVGMVWIDSLNQVYVVEATHPRVQITPIAAFLIPKGKEDCPPVSVVGRLKAAYQPLIPQAIQEAKKHVGKLYDDAFDLKNDTYYCSELVYLALYEANQQRDVFPLNVMTFKSAQTGAYAPYWVSHFEQQGVAIPEGELGINPGAMSKAADIIDIVYAYPRTK